MYNNRAHTQCIHFPISAQIGADWGWLWLSLLSLPLYTKLSDLCINLPQYQFWVKYSNFKIFPQGKKYAYNQVQGNDIHLSTCKTFVWSVMRTYPHGICQVVMWHLHLLVPHQVFSLLWVQHLTLPAFHLSQCHWVLW